jgi:hypothetical protein
MTETGAPRRGVAPWGEAKLSLCGRSPPCCERRCSARRCWQCSGNNSALVVFG